MGKPRHQQLEQAFKGLTIGVITDLKEHEQRLYEDGLQPIEEEFHIGLNGRAEEFPVWQLAVIKFGVVFVDATGQRDSDLIRPTFTYGAKIDTQDPVGLFACVMSYHENDRGEIRGANVQIGVASSDYSTRFRGSLHAKFSGWGQPANVFPDQDLT